MVNPEEHIRQLMRLYMTDQATPGQVKELLQLLNDPAKETEYTSLLQEAMAETAASTGRQPQFGDPGDAWESILNARDSLKSSVPRVHRVHFMRRWGWAAAAVLLFVVCGLWFVVGRRGAEKPELVQTALDIVPGRDRAVLKLGNGQTILLDSMRGNIVQQDGFTVINSAGKLDYEGRSGEVEYHTLSTPRGGQYKLQLPDGTAVWLNAASSISYPTAFEGKERKVTITGEAYFEVAKNKEKPFIVDVDGKQTVEVLGTHFNINSYADEDAIRTTLLEGKVKVSATQPETSNPKPETVLSPGQQASLQHDQLTTTKNVDINNVMAWKNGFISFEGAAFSAVMKDVERWYDITIRYEGKVPAVRIEGRMDRGVQLSGMLKFLSNFGVKARLEGRTLIIEQ